MSIENYTGQLLRVKSLEGDHERVDNLVPIPYQEEEIEELSISIIKLKPDHIVLHCGVWSPNPSLADNFALLLVNQKLFKSWIKIGTEYHWFNV